MTALDPLAGGLTDYIQLQSFKFQTSDDPVNLLGPNYFMAKIDLQHAYRSVPIHYTNFATTGLRWQFEGHNHFTYMYDMRLPFGAKSSPEILTFFNNRKEAMLEKKSLDSAVQSQVWVIHLKKISA